MKIASRASSLLRHSILTISALISAALLSMNAMADVGVSPNEYHLLGEAKTGTRIPTKLVTSPLPLEATYADLNEADKAYIRSNYQNMPESDEPPYPVEGLHEFWDEVTKVRYARNQIGDVVAIASVSPEGKVEKVEVYDTTSTYMTKVISTALFALPFKPAVCNGKACAMEFILEGKMNIDLMQN